MNNALADLLLKNQKEILEQWMKNQLSNNTLREDLMSNENLRRQSQELLDLFLKAVKKGNYDDLNTREYEGIIEMLQGISISRAQQGYSPKETAIFVFSLKEALINTIVKADGDSKEAVNSILIINNLLDQLGIITFETFIRGRESVILRQTQEINEISTPVIRVWEGILALPIIGTLDSARTQIVMENLLQEIVNTGSSIAILDISGVPAVDSLVAQHLIKTVSATRLMGAECIISGIRAEIAQTIVHLGIDLSNIQTKASLASALKLAFAMLQLEVKKGERKIIK
ncbi:MAG: STAS domain-containing protein [Sporocytophaga sp.]|uniref:STAS domain-containing protein n=1 Tax=Sporocytophaga sp. TaxID=2231183 RepID=UPI001AFEDA60|nr:STAS domain-containing protein [Sporocytophaga sp.]MBO9701841.1 STAS domain-containing protein [Sporocytophaga sp.]